ncbi:TlpA family protein disulfide reductase [Verrucomicrobiaceae bacterium 227]
MKNPLRSLSLLLLAHTLPCHGLGPGDDVSIQALSKAEFIQGEAPASWAQDEIYIFECWATWCGPCLRAIPHMDELHDRHHTKGLNIYGMNVWEDGKDKVSGFVKTKGDGMSYPVAYVGRGGDFETSWLEPAGVTGIPRALVVKNGKLLFSAHPVILTEETISTLLAGGDEADKLTREIQEREGHKTRIAQLQRTYQKAMIANDLAKMVAARDELGTLVPDADYLPAMNLDILLAGKDWVAAEAFLNQTEAPKVAAMYARKISFKIDTIQDGIAPSLRESMIAKIKGTSKLQVLDRPIIARIQWDLGLKDAALATARESVEKDPNLPEEVMAAFVAGFEPGGTPQTFSDFQKSLSGFHRKKREAEAAK